MTITPEILKKMYTEKQLYTMKMDAIYKPRYTIYEGAIRSGKTFGMIPTWLKHIYQYKDKKLKFIMSGDTLATLKSNVLDDMSNIYGIDTHLNQYGEFELFGNTIKCVGSSKSDSYKKIKGMTVYGWFGNEITESHRSFVDMAISRCSGNGARIFWDTNPETPTHYIKTQYIDKSGDKFKSGKTRILSHHFKLTDNTHLSEEYIESLKLDYPKDSVWYKRYIEGLWVVAGNVIYSNYESFSQDNLSGIMGQYDEILAGLDFGRGGKSPSAFVLIGRRGSAYYILFEVVRAEVINSKFIEEVERELNNINPQLKSEITIYGDSADPDKIDEWNDAGFYCKKADKTAGSVLRGIEEVMKHDIFINVFCNITHKEIENYEWRTDKNGDIIEEPVKFADHCMDAIRYCIYTHEKKYGGSSNSEPLASIGVCD